MPAPADVLPDDVFSANRLLATLPDEMRPTLGGLARVIHLVEGDTVVKTGIDVSETLFPLGATTISLKAEIDSEDSIQAASIGSEGAIGGIVSCGSRPAFAHAEVLVGGKAVSLPMDALERLKGESAHVRNLFCRYADYLLAQIMQSVACNSFHSIEQRTARWLLTAGDRAGHRLELTQEKLAGLLGVQRTTLNAVVRTLQDRGAIVIRRGAIEILDREALLRASCICYPSVERYFGDVIGKGTDAWGCD